MPFVNFNYIDNLTCCFKKHLFDNEHDTEKAIIKQATKVIFDFEKTTGFLKIQKTKSKLIQSLSQSYEIKTGDLLEEFFSLLFSSEYNELPKSVISNGVEVLRYDQLFEKDDKIVFIEMKIRDNHDSSKKGGQSDNFEKKVRQLKSDYPNKVIDCYEWFVDDLTSKNEKYYNERIDALRGENIPNVVLHNAVYGKELFVLLFGEDNEIWNQFVDAYNTVKNDNSFNISNVINNYDFDSDPDGIVFSICKTKRTSTLIKLFFSNECSNIVFDLFSNNHMLSKLCGEFENRKSRKLFIDYCNERGVQ